MLRRLRINEPVTRELLFVWVDNIRVVVPSRLNRMQQRKPSHLVSYAHPPPTGSGPSTRSIDVTEIVHSAHQGEHVGTTVIRGIELGASSLIHVSRLFRLSRDLPLLIVIVGAEDRVRVFQPRFAELKISDQ